MGAGIDQKGALGQQLAASGRARRAEKIRREGEGRSPIPGGKGRARAVIEDRMDQNDKEGKQKQGKPGRPGRPIDGKPPVSRPIEGDMPPKEPPWMDGKPLPPKEGRPIGDDNWATLPYFPGKPPEGSLPGRPPGGRPDRPFPPRDGKPFPPRDGDVRIQPFPYPGRPPKGDRPIRGKDQFGPGEIPGRPSFGGKKGPRRGGTEFGPGRGSRIPEGQVGLFGKVGGAGGLQDFLARMAQLRGGGIK